MKRIKRILAFIVCVSLMCGNVFVTQAAEKVGAENWSITNISLEHKKISFTVSNVESAQEATLLILNAEDSTQVMEAQFSITSANDNISIDLLDEEYLPAASYYVCIVDGKGNRTSNYNKKVYTHTLELNGDAYVNCIIGTDRYKNMSKITAEVGFQKYDGEINSDGNVRINYPAQKVGSTIIVSYEDKYGCSGKCNMTIQYAKLSTPSLEVFRNSISLGNFSKLYSDERLCAEVNGTIYYSEYGCGFGSKGIIKFPYISNDIAKIYVWVESSYGSEIKKKEYDIEKCTLRDCDYTYSVYPEKAMGTVTANEYGHIPSFVSTSVDGIQYQATINASGEFILNYPKPLDTVLVSITFTDEHGCTYSVSKIIFDTWSQFRLDWNIVDFLPKKLTVKDVNIGAKLYVSIGDQIYSSQESTEANGKTVTVNYPSQAAGTPLKIWAESSKGKSQIWDYEIPGKPYLLTANAKTTSVSGIIYLEDSNTCNLTTVYVKAGGKNYACTLKKTILKEDEDDNIDGLSSGKTEAYAYKVSYPKQKVGSKIEVMIEDTDGYCASKVIILKNIAPKINLDKVDSSTSRITGTTTASSSIKVIVGNKKYSAKANSYGYFSIKIKQQKVGTRISISVLTPAGYTATKTTKVSETSSSIRLNKNIYRTSKSAAVSISNGKKGDLIVLKIGAKQYTKKLKSNSKKQKVNISIKNVSLGSSITVTLKDKFGKKKDYDKSMVYYGNTIYIGMSAKNATLTTWGYPIKKNNWGTGSEQWVYVNGYGKTIYVYVKNGKVIGYQG